ncbi:hypothetical protein VNO77_42107 [Canavalia gladiata]|uniref:Dehydrogenase E1 component domain-containing protein n=1 Tax=Canavalia gladiata TaxID=3824 RepID=A0AAN9K3I2_CANGL
MHIIWGYHVRCLSRSYSIPVKGGQVAVEEEKLSKKCDGIVVKGQAYAIWSIRVDGNDALAVYSAVHTAREVAIREKDEF